MIYEFQTISILGNEMFPKNYWCFKFKTTTIDLTKRTVM